MGNIIIEFLMKSIGRKEFKLVMREFNGLLKAAPFKIFLKCLFFYMPQKAFFVISPQTLKDKLMNMFNRFQGNTMGVFDNVYLGPDYRNITDCSRFLIDKVRPASK